VPRGLEAQLLLNAADRMRRGRHWTRAEEATAATRHTASLRGAHTATRIDVGCPERAIAAMVMSMTDA